MNRRDLGAALRAAGLAVLERLPLMPLAVPGIYFLFLRNVLQYIGEAENIPARVPAHIGAKAFDAAFFLPFHGTKTERKALERKLIVRFDPPLNREPRKRVSSYERWRCDVPRRKRTKRGQNTWLDTAWWL